MVTHSSVLAWRIPGQRSLVGGYSPWNSQGQNTGEGSLSLLQGNFPIQGSNPDLPHDRQIFYQLSHQGSPGGVSKLKQKMCLLRKQSLEL